MPLSETYDSLRKAIGRHLGYTANLTTIEADSERSADVEEALKRGCRKMWYLRNAGEKEPYHVWSFLQKDLVLSLAVGAAETDLPQDFWYLLGNLTFDSDSELSPISIVPEEQIRALRASSNATGAPKYAAVRARAVIDGQRYELITYPRPDVAYTVTGRYGYEPPALSDNRPNPPGGALHSEALLYACLSSAEEVLNPEAGPGLLHVRFQELLANSVKADQSMVGKQDDAAWPNDAATTATDLGVTRSYIDQQIALILGFGPNTTAWTHGQQAEIARARESGMRRFYGPEVLPNESQPHTWSFLRPLYTLYVSADVEAYDLPTTLSRIDGPFTFAPESSIMRPPIVLVSEQQVRHKLEAADAAGTPRIAATRAKTPRGDQQSRQEVIFFPKPDAAYELKYRAVLNPYSLPESTSVPLGSPEHAETIITACLIAAEEMAGVAKSTYARRYMELLRSSVARDRQRNKSDVLGQIATWEGLPNDDLGVDTGYPYDQQYVTYNGTIPE